MTDYARARAVRWAFLVDPSEDPGAVLDDLFAACYGVYGGRYSLIVPIHGGEISDAYWRFLEATDADVVYSYVEVSPKLERQIHERLYPAHLLQHRKPREDGRRRGAFRPHLPFQPLSSLSVLPAVHRKEWRRPEAPLHLVDGWQGREPGRFVMDNFGTRANSFAHWSRSYPEREIVRSLSFVSDDVLKDPRRAPGADDAYFQGTTELLNLISTKRVTSVAQLSGAETRRLECRDPRWCERVNIFVGDDFPTRLAFWNSRLLMPAWLDGQLISWRVRTSDLSEMGFAQAFFDLVQRNSHVSSSGGGSPEARFWCGLGGLQEAEAVISQINGTRHGLSISLERLESLDVCTPSIEAIKYAREVEAGGHLTRDGSTWVSISRRAASLTIDDCMPSHLASVPAEQRQLLDGVFAIDCDIERSNNLSIYSNVVDRWRFGRRLRVAQGFQQEGELGCDVRANRSGLLTVFGSVGGDLVPRLAEPEDDVAVRWALVRGRAHLIDRHDGNRRALAEQIAFEVQRSDCGKYLLGVIEQFGGLRETQDFLLHPFWDTQFRALGATPTIHSLMIDNLSNKLAKRARSVPSYDITSPERRRELAEWSLREASQERRERRFVQFDILKQAHHELFQQYTNEHEAKDSIEGYNEEERWQAELTQSLEYLCQRQVMHQGYAWSCRNCLHRNWIGITSLSRELACSVCGHGFPAPVDRPWQFRLSEFVQRAIRDHGVTALVWALRGLQEEAHREPMYFLGPTALFYTADAYDAGKIDSEIDLLVMCGTKLTLVEAKNSVRDLQPSQVLGPALRIRPNRVVIAIMEKNSTAAVSRVGAIREELRDLPTDVELITLDDWPLNRDPWLPGVRGRRIVRM